MSTWDSTSRATLFKSPLVRQALDLAVNRKAIVDGVLKGAADLPRGTIPMVLSEFFDSSLPAPAYLPDSAKSLLESCRVATR